MTRARPSDAATPIPLPSEWSRRRFTALTLLVAFGLYGVALNPYLLPDTYDNVMYLVGARAIAAHGTFTFGGFRIADWPPGLSALLAIPIAVGVDTVITAKLVVLGTVLLSLWLSIRLLVREERPHARLVTLAVAMLPTAFLIGVRLMSEWPYTAASLALLLLLHRLDDVKTPGRRFGLALAGGALLGFAALTRFVGVTLGAAVLAQALLAGRGQPLAGRIRAALPGLIVALVGGALTLAWRTSVAADTAQGLSWVFYAARQTHLFESIDVLGLASALADLLFRAGRVAQMMKLPQAFPAMVGLGAAGLMAMGAIVRIRTRGMRLSDPYVWATLALLLGVEWKHGRYLVPIAPFLLSDLLLGGRALLYGLMPARRRMCDWVIFTGAALWLILSAVSNGLLLVRGNGHSHGGLLLMVSPSAERFYTAEWHDLSLACSVVRGSNDSRSVLVVGRHDLLYPTIWCERSTVRVPEEVAIPTRDDLCAAPPYPTEHGYSVTERGAPTPPLRSPPSVAAPALGCATGWALVQAPATLPASLPGVPPLHKVGVWGDFTLWHAESPRP